MVFGLAVIFLPTITAGMFSYLIFGNTCGRLLELHRIYAPIDILWSMDEQIQQPKQQPSDLSGRLKSYYDARGPALLLILIIVLGQGWIAYSLTTGPVWIIPVVALGLILPSILLYDPSHFESDKKGDLLKHHNLVRSIFFVLIIIVALEIFWFVGDIFNPSTTNAAIPLLITGIAVWLVSIAVFALAYWEIDSGGPERRALGIGGYPDFVFPQQQAGDSDLVPPDWQPNLIDYLFVSLTASTGFSPSYAIPYSRVAKITMGTESVMSLFILGMLIARAVNIV